MRFYAFGLNHESAPVQTREAFAVADEALPRIHEAVQLSPEAELILLSTCNRTEGYLFGAEEDVTTVQSVLCAEAGRAWPDAGFLIDDEAAVQHVMEVACGLRSLVLGETQILAQMKEAYRAAVDADMVSSQLHRLMHTTFRASKRVSRETELSSGAASVASAAVATARSHFAGEASTDLAGRNVLLVGAGRMGRLALDALRADDLGTLTVTNRTPERAREIAASFDAEPVAWDARHDAAARADLVIVATGADEPVIAPDALRAESETVFIDIAVPRNVAQGVREVPGAAVYDLDALNEHLVATEERRKAAAPEARAIVEEVMSDFVTWFFHQQALQPAIQALRSTFESIRTQEIDRHAHRLADTDREEIDRLTQSILQKLLAIPIVRLKDTDPESIDFVRGIRLLNTLFSRPGCDDDESEEAAIEDGESPLLEQVMDRSGAFRDELDQYRALRTPATGSDE
jgi:glutamyl-tRNA reductase